MKRTVLTYGFISGAIAAVFMLVTLPFLHSLRGNQGFVVGYTGIVLAALLVFFGVRSYRENVGQGRITFGRGFAVGILITVISCVCYVATWELIYFKLRPGIMDTYLSAPVERLRAQGAAPERIEAAQRQADSLKKTMDNPLSNAALTFIEPFPVGLLITLISAGVLRRKETT